MNTRRCMVLLVENDISICVVINSKESKQCLTWKCENDTLNMLRRVCAALYAHFFSPASLCIPKKKRKKTSLSVFGKRRVSWIVVISCATLIHLHIHIYTHKLLIDFQPLLFKQCLFKQTKRADGQHPLYSATLLPVYVYKHPFSLSCFYFYLFFFFFPLLISRVHFLGLPATLVFLSQNVAGIDTHSIPPLHIPGRPGVHITKQINIHLRTYICTCIVTKRDK